MSTMKFTSWQDLDGNEVANSAYPPGLVLVKSQTIGTAVSSVTVNDAFSSAFDSYKIVVSGGTPAGSSLIYMRLGSTTTGYYVARMTAATPNTTLNNQAEYPYAGAMSTGWLYCSLDVHAPNLPTRTWMTNTWAFGGGASIDGGVANCELQNNTQYTAFTLLFPSNTVTGGIIRVYGYTK